MRKIIRPRRGQPRNDIRPELLDELEAARVSLADAYGRFNSAVEPDLVDACVYEINAMQSRYGYLLRLAKQRGAKAALKAWTEEAPVWA